MGENLERAKAEWRGHSKAWWYTFVAGWIFWIVLCNYAHLSFFTSLIFLILLQVYEQLGRIAERDRIAQEQVRQPAPKEPRMR